MSELAGLGVSELDVGVVPARRVVELARYGLAAKAPALARHDDPRRSATLLATARRLQVRAVDDALDLFEVLMSTELLVRAERESVKDKLRRYPRISRDAGRLAAAVGVLFEASEWGGQVSLDLGWDAIENVVSRTELRVAVEHVAEVLPAPDVDPEGEWRERLLARYPAVLGFVPLLCEVIDFDATGGRPVGTVDRAGYVFCVLEQFHRHLTRRNIFAATSTRWADPRAHLLAAPPDKPPSARR